MYISKFNKFFQQLNETVELPILDIVIDDNGIIYNGQEAPLVKGRIERVSRGVVTKILGTNNTLYPAGIDKNGNVVAIETDDEGRALNSKGLPIEIPSFIQARYKVKIPYYYASPEYDYYNLIPIEPTGWVNVKIDMEIVKRVKRYAKSLGTNTKSHQSFIDKLLEFEKFSTQKREEKYISRLKRGTIQKEMSCILLLHYINEIKDFFNPSQSGFLFESFIAGLIPDSRIKEDNSPVDIKTSHDRYQLKLVDWKTDYVEITMDNDLARSRYLEHYMIALKYIDRIELLIIDGVELEKRVNGNTIGDLITKGKRRVSKKESENLTKTKTKPDQPKFKIKSLSLISDDSLLKKITIDLTDIDGRIQNLGENLKMSLSNLYEELSKFQYNVETIITGVNEKGGVVKEQSEFDIYHLKAEDNIKKLAEHLKNLVADINR
jgi:hypothetical protein